MNTQLQIQSSLAQLGMTITPLQMNIKNSKTEMTIESRPADMTIQRHDPEFSADWTLVWEDLGLKRPSTIASEWKEKSIQEGLKATEQIARDGDRIANLKSREKNVAGNIAFEAFMRKRGEVEIVVDALPNQGPDFEVDVQMPSITITPNDPEINVHHIPPQIDVRLGDVKVYLEREPMVDIYV